MSKVKTQYGDLTEKQWKLVVVEKLIAIEKLLIKVAYASGIIDATKEAVMRYEQERKMYELKKLAKEQEAKKT